MADLKLIADSGGGTVSLKAPAATTSNAAVTLKLPVADGTSGQALTTSGSGQLSFTTITSTPTTTRGDIIYRGASADLRLAKGTSGQYLKIGANDPEWADVVGAVADGCIYENDLTISNNYTIAATKGAHSVGPITNNAVVTLNGVWVIS
tara:strand:+ start:119 stop:568 length:450 start_codon:yes stop_codon:yes gene_type:complete